MASRKRQTCQNEAKNFCTVCVYLDGEYKFIKNNTIQYKGLLNVRSCVRVKIKKYSN